MFLTFEAAPAPAMPANDAALVAKVVAAQAAQARAEYESATQATRPLPIHEVTGLLEAVHGLTVKYYKRDTRIITIVADDAARLFADSDPATQVACYPNGRTVYSVAVGGWTVRFDQIDAPLPPAEPLPPASPTTSPAARQPSPPAKVYVDTMSLSELEAAMLAAPYGDAFDVLVAEWTARLLARVVTGDDGLDHYL